MVVLASEGMLALSRSGNNVDVVRVKPSNSNHTAVRWQGLGSSSGFFRSSAGFLGPPPRSLIMALCRLRATDSSLIPACSIPL
jgi:hypothetical protein